MRLFLLERMEMSGYIQQITENLIGKMGPELFSKSANLISGLSPLFAAGFGLYILLIVLAFYNRGFDESFVDLSKRCLGWLIIISFAFNADMYQKIANMAYELPESLGSLIAAGKFESSALDSSVDEFIGSVGKIFDAAAALPITEIGGKFAINIAGIVLTVIGVLFLVIIVAFYVVAKLSLAMVILVGPIFIGAMLFPATRQWGMNWIGQILNYSIVISFYVILTLIQYNYFETFVLPMTSEFEGATGVAVMIPVIANLGFSTIIFTVVAFSVPSIASALTGGASIGGFGSVANAARQAVMLTKTLGMGKRTPSSGGNIAKAK